MYWAIHRRFSAVKCFFITTFFNLIHKNAVLSFSTAFAFLLATAALILPFLYFSMVTILHNPPSNTLKTVEITMWQNGNGGVILEDYRISILTLKRRNGG